MKLPKLKTKFTNATDEEKSGFTIIEVMLVLGLTGLLLVGLLGGTFSAIKSQRYNDSVRSFAEYLRTIYSEVISPESFGDLQNPDKQVGNAKDDAILGKVLVFGHNYGNFDDNRAVYSATLVGSASLDTSGDNFMQELDAAGARLYCGDEDRDVQTTVSRYLPLWEAELTRINDSDKGWNTSQEFQGTLIIARSPVSGAVHTYYSQAHNYDLRDNCTPSNFQASNALQQDIKATAENVASDDTRFITDVVGFCVKSENSARYREVRLAKDGRNTSAVTILNTDTDINGIDNGDQNRCL